MTLCLQICVLKLRLVLSALSSIAAATSGSPREGSPVQNLSEPHLKISVASLGGDHTALTTSFSLEGAHQTAREPGLIISSDLG